MGMEWKLSLQISGMLIYLNPEGAKNMSCCPCIKCQFVNHCQDRMEWFVQVKLFVSTRSELSFVLSSFSFPATSIFMCVSATHMLVHFFLNVLIYSVWCDNCKTIKDVPRCKLHSAMRVLSWIICHLRAAFSNLTWGSWQFVKCSAHVTLTNTFFWLWTATEEIVRKPLWDWSVHILVNNFSKYCCR